MNLRARWWALAVLFVSMSAAAQVPLPLFPSGIAYDAAGNLYFADTNRHQVYESSLGGVLTVVAGSGVQGFGGDGGAAVAAMLDSPQAVAVGSDGTIYIADTGNQRIRAVSVAGVMTTFAGSGARGFGGDGDAATVAKFSQPIALAVDASGALLIADSGNQRVRRVGSGVITTIAGSGIQGFGGDGGAATAAMLDTPAGVAAMADGRLLIADSHNQRVRVVATDGTIATFAGSGIAGFSGDGDAATAAKLSLPRGLAALPDGSVVFADSDNQRLRSVNAAGMISTIAGTGLQGVSADASVGIEASLNTPRGVAASSFGAAVFADTPNRLVRALVDGGALFSAAGLVSSQASSVVMSLDAAGRVAVTVSGRAGTPKGVVQVIEAGNVLGQGTLVGGATTIVLSPLALGSHTLVASYLGDGLNPASKSAAVSLTTSLAASTTTLQPVVNTYVGLPVVLSASVAGVGGTPTGLVTFLDGDTPVATGQIVAGGATVTWLTAGVGPHSLVASYGGDAKFLPSSSAVNSVAVKAMPDFTIGVSGSASQVASVGTLATFQIIVGAQPGPFSGAVSLSANGLPAGVVVTFSPDALAPGSSTASATMSVPTETLLGAKRDQAPLLWFAGPPFLLVVFRRRRRVLMAFGLLLLVGCGDRVVSESMGKTKVYSITVTGTATNLAGVVVTHSTPVQLTVE